MGKKDNNTVKKLAVGTAIAGAVGYVAGILTAPKSGKETRLDIADKAEEIKQNLVEQLQDLSDSLHQLLKTAKAKTLGLSSSARADFNEAVIRAKDAQNKATHVLKAVKNGESTDGDLNKAIKQAKLAKKNLEKYLQN
jgi:gas vesicle protein